MHVVPDTSAVVDGRVTDRIADGTYAGATVVVPEAVVAELESQANRSLDSGWDGIAELKRLADLADAGDISLEYVGERPAAGASAEAGDVDAVIRALAAEYDATLLTSDVVQREVAEAKGITVDFVEARSRGGVPEGLAVEQFFDESTMSVHLRAGARPRAKRGSVEAVHYEVLDDEPLEEGQVREWAQEVESAARSDPQGFLELEEPGMLIAQYRDFRIAVARPPFSDAVEITAVRPIAKTVLADYTHHEEIESRLLERERGVLIAGSPGAGKSTFGQAAAEFLAEHDQSVKTMEKPRDLQVSEEITQYTALGGSMAKTADSLLMVRPDYTIYDEVRKTEDFEVFADMRLAGVGMVGVVHATRAIDALQRLVGRVELGMIPQVVDTVVYIEAGDVHTLYDVRTEVKVPHGLFEEDLARPVIVVEDHETGRPAYEIYTFNRQVVTVPIGEEEEGEAESGMERLASQEIEREIQSLTQGRVDVEVTGPDHAVVYVSEDDISYVIGKGGGRISKVEDRLGVDIDVRTHAERPGRGGGPGGAGGGGGPAGGGGGGAAPGGPGGGGGAGGAGGHAGEVVVPEITGNHVVVSVESGHAGETVEVRADGEYLFTATVGRGGEIQVSRGSAIAEELETAIDHERTITVVPS
ncbi:MAG: PINc/VapC family ATPase [Halobacteriaceae archaeon]